MGWGSFGYNLGGRIVVRLCVVRFFLIWLEFCNIF